MQKFKVFLHMRGNYKVLITKIFVLLAGNRGQILHRPFEKIEKKLGKKNSETPEIDIDDAYVGQVTGGVKVVARNTPGESKCLVRCITAKKILNDKGLPCTLYMGVKNEDEGKLQAHAGLRCGKKYVTGRNGSKKYTITAKYGNI